MAMVNVVNWQPTGGLMVQADRLGPKVGGHLAPCCIHRVNQGELAQCFKHDDSTINIVLVLLLLLMRANATAKDINTAHKCQRRWVKGTYILSADVFDAEFLQCYKVIQLTVLVSETRTRRHQIGLD